MKIFYDKNDMEIKPGQILIRKFVCMRRERAGNKRVATNGMTGIDYIIPDEGNLIDPTEEWIKYKIQWNGACLIAKKIECSNELTILNSEHFDNDGNHIIKDLDDQYMDNFFNSKDYEICTIK